MLQILPNPLSCLMNSSESSSVAGLVVFELALVVALTILATRQVRSRAAMMAGLALMPPGLALLVVAQGLSSTTILRR
jgi:hypothetical protein